MNFIAPDIAQLDLGHYMREALVEAELAGQAGELPIGAVVVIDGEVVARGRARHKERQSQLAHAELNALQAGGERLWRDYRRAVVFSTCEPCPMCLGALVMADVPHVIFALHDKVVFSEQTVETNPYVKRHIKSYYGGVMAEAAEAIFRQYAPRDLNYILTGSN